MVTREHARVLPRAVALRNGGPWGREGAGGNPIQLVPLRYTVTTCDSDSVTRSVSPERWICGLQSRVFATRNGWHVLRLLCTGPHCRVHCPRCITGAWKRSC